LLGYRFRRQQGIGPFIVDFFCHELKLAIEVDGASHEREEAKDYDNRRQANLETAGIRFLRFTDDEVLGNVEKVLIRIEEAMRLLAHPPPDPLPKR
jgi:very-short-patch-repair endonuclease